jgi:hypothetical protein
MIRKLASGSAIRAVNLLATALVSMLIMPFVVHALGDRMYGTWALVATIIGAGARGKGSRRGQPGFQYSASAFLGCGSFCPRCYRAPRFPGALADEKPVGCRGALEADPDSRSLLGTPVSHSSPARSTRGATALRQDRRHRLFVSGFENRVADRDSASRVQNRRAGAGNRGLRDPGNRFSTFISFPRNSPSCDSSQDIGVLTPHVNYFRSASTVLSQPLRISFAFGLTRWWWHPMWG